MPVPHHPSSEAHFRGWDFHQGDSGGRILLSSALLANLLQHFEPTFEAIEILNAAYHLKQIQQFLRSLERPLVLSLRLYAEEMGDIEFLPELNHWLGNPLDLIEDCDRHYWPKPETIWGSDASQQYTVQLCQELQLGLATHECPVPSIYLAHEIELFRLDQYYG